MSRMGTVHIKVIIICQARHVRLEISQQCAVFLNVRDNQPFLESVCHSQLKSNTKWGDFEYESFWILHTLPVWSKRTSLFQSNDS